MPENDYLSDISAALEDLEKLAPMIDLVIAAAKKVADSTENDFNGFIKNVDRSDIQALQGAVAMLRDTEEQLEDDKKRRQENSNVYALDEVREKKARENSETK